MTSINEKLFEAIKKDICITGSLHERVELNKVLIEVCEILENLNYEKQDSTENSTRIRQQRGS